MNNVAAIDIVKCEGGGCLARIRPGERFCTKCEQMYVDLELKRIESMRRPSPVDSAYDCCEADGFALPNLLLETTPRERLTILAICVGVVLVALGLGALLLLGARDLVAYLLKVSATS